MLRSQSTIGDDTRSVSTVLSHYCGNEKFGSYYRNYVDERIFSNDVMELVKTTMPEHLGKGTGNNQIRLEKSGYFHLKRTNIFPMSFLRKKQLEIYLLHY